MTTLWLRERGIIVRDKHVVVTVNGTQKAEGTVDRMAEKGSLSVSSLHKETLLHIRKIEIKKILANKTYGPPPAVAPTPRLKP